MSTPLADRITQYLSLGGLWNPEAMHHDTVRDLLIECRTELATARADAFAECAKICRNIANTLDGPYRHYTSGTECAEAIERAAKGKV